VKLRIWLLLKEAELRIWWQKRVENQLSTLWPVRTWNPGPRPPAADDIVVANGWRMMLKRHAGLAFTRGRYGMHLLDALRRGHAPMDYYTFVAYSLLCDMHMMNSVQRSAKGVTEYRNDLLAAWYYRSTDRGGPGVLLRGRQLRRARRQGSRDGR
jgi:hypothetical protein